MNFYTEKDIKDMLQLGDRQVHALMQTDGFPSVKIGREYRVEQTAFEEWAQSIKKVTLNYEGINRPRTTTLQTN